MSFDIFVFFIVA